MMIDLINFGIENFIIKLSIVISNYISEFVKLEKGKCYKFIEISSFFKSVFNNAASDFKIKRQFLFFKFL